MAGQKVTVLGAGAWGTALATLLARNGNDVLLWAREEKVAAEINESHSNSSFLPDMELPKVVRATVDLEEACDHSPTIIEVVPVKYLRSVLEQIKPFLSSEHRFVVTSKGLEVETLKTPLEIVNDICGDNGPHAALGGPNFAREVARGAFSASMIASKDGLFVEEVASLLSSPQFVVVRSEDTVGLQIGGALKNVVAIAVGIARGIGTQDNGCAYLITRGLQETALLAESLGGKRDTIYDLPGVGDLVLTTTGKQSRNLRAGVRIGQGANLDDLLDELPVLPEGINTLSSIVDLATRQGLKLPLCSVTHAIVHAGLEPTEFFRVLLESSE